jgi:hypothetical protein
LRVQNSVKKLAVLTDECHGIPQLHLANITIIPQAGHEKFFSWFFQFIVHKSSNYSMLHFDLITAFPEITVKSYNNDIWKKISFLFPGNATWQSDLSIVLETQTRI